MSFTLPIIDLSKAKSNRQELAKTVVDGLENIGFLFIDNIEGLDFELWFDCCKWFFKQPDEVKKALLRNFWNPEAKNVYRGYFPVVEGEPSRKEGFEFARDVDPDDPTISKDNWFYEPSVWPKEDGSFPFKKNMQTIYEKLHDTAMEILRLTSIGLGIQEDSFLHLFSSKPCTTFRIMHYPPWNGSPPENARIEDGKVVTTPDHTDSNFLTLLALFDYKGLEVLMSDGKWGEVNPRPYSLVMNIGDTFSRMMGGRFKATRHRVIDIGVDRYTSPFFLSPRFDANIAWNVVSQEKEEQNSENPRHKFKTFGAWELYLMKHEKKYFEYRVLPEIEG